MVSLLLLLLPAYNAAREKGGKEEERGRSPGKGRGERNQIISLFCLKSVNISHCTGNKFNPTLPWFTRHHMNWLLVHFSKPPLPLHSALATGLLEAPIKRWALSCLSAFAFVLFAPFYLPYFHVTGSFSPFSAHVSFPSPCLSPWKHLPLYKMILLAYFMSFTGRI